MMPKSAARLRKRCETLAAIGALLIALAGAAASAEREPVRTDGYGFPLYPHVHPYSVFVDALSYTSSDDIERILAWYRDRTAVRWTGGSVVRRGRVRTAELDFEDGLGTHRLAVRQADGETALILGMLVFADFESAKANGDALHGRVDPLGVPLYPHRLRGKALALTAGHRGVVSYGTADPFDTVVRWFNARLSNRYAISYRRHGHGTSMQTFDGGEMTVSITHRVSDGTMTVIGVQRLEVDPTR
jgi:hypothetical protein